jgi:hypothetical protein
LATIAGPFTGDPVAAAFMMPAGMFALAYAWWPRLRITDTCLEIRNLYNHRIAWADVVRVKTKDQLPHLPKGWRTLHRWFGRIASTKDVGYLGICAMTNREGGVPAIALQAVSPWWNIRSTSPSWMDQIEMRLRTALKFARSGRSAIAGYRSDPPVQGN